MAQAGALSRQRTSTQRRDRAQAQPRRQAAAGPPAGQAERRQEQQSSGGRRKVQTQEGAQRYGVAVGQYIPESTGGAAITENMQGRRVALVQDLLARSGFLDEGSGANKGRDGKFGPATAAALKAFQEANGLKPTGVFDYATSKALNAAAPGGDPAGGKAKAPATTPPGAPGPNRTVPTAQQSNEGPARAPGEPKPDGTQTTADAIVALRMEHFGLEPRNARPKAPKLTDDAVPVKSPGGAGIVDFNGAGTGVAIYSDGTVYDGSGWQPGNPAKRKGAKAQPGDGAAKPNPDATPEGDRSATTAEDRNPSPNYEGETVGSRRAKAKKGRGKLEEDDPPPLSPTDAEIVDFDGSNGRMTYADGSYFDVDGWHNVPKAKRRRKALPFDDELAAARRLALLVL